MTFPASVTRRSRRLPGRARRKCAPTRQPLLWQPAGTLPGRSHVPHVRILQQPGNAPNHPAATRRQLFPPRSCRLRQTKPNKEPALGCGLVHRSVSSACGPNRSSLLQQRRPQAEKTSIDHALVLARIFLKTGLNRQLIRQDRRTPLVVWSCRVKIVAAPMHYNATEKNGPGLHAPSSRRLTREPAGTTNDPWLLFIISMLGFVRQIRKRPCQ